jgi:EAL domain-containing protein (putative c-di-GMP-specific phosphodiesterase class I)
LHDQATRRNTPLVCVTDGKEHIRRFLREALSEFRFVIQECVEAAELSAALDSRKPDLVVLGLTAGATEACDMLQALADKDFEGKVLPFAPRDSAVVSTVQERAEKLGIALLPPLLMPFSNESLRESIATLLPDQSAGPLIDMSEAVREDWIELWYQPKIDARALAMRGAEALLRVRHPVWGIVPPAYFAPDDNGGSDGVSNAVISRAIEDWHRFFAQNGPVETAINLPIAVLKDHEAIGRLCKRLPTHAAFEGLVVEINGAELMRNLDAAIEAARTLRLHKVAIAIDDAGPEWLSVTDVSNFPFVEFKVGRKLVAGCADDRLKQSICRRLLELANFYGSRTVADGIDTWSDFLTVRDLGFDLVQGSLFAKPMSAAKFAQTCWAAPQGSAAPPLSRSIERLSIAGGIDRLAEAQDLPARLSGQDTKAQRR